jgi:hypothetical protein
LNKQSKSKIMASIKMGAIVTEIKGSVGGTTFQSSNAGLSMKNKGKCMHGKAKGYAQRHDGTHVPQQGNFSQVTKAWAGLTDVQRATWSGLLGIWTFKNKFGEVYNGSAYQIFCAANINRLTLGLSLLTVAPTKVDMVDPMVTYSDYSISGVFEETRANASAIGSMGFLYITYPANSTSDYKKIRRAGSIVRSYMSVGTTSRKAEVQALFGGNPPLGSVFYGVMWWCFPDYPNQQFFTVYTIKVVA